MQTTNTKSGTYNHSLRELLQDLSNQTQALVRAEVQLAKVELTETGKEVGKDVAFLAMGGAIAYAGFLAILAAIIIGLAAFIPAWVSALVVGLVVAGIGFLLVQQGRSNLQRAELAPKETIDTLQEDKEWVKRKVTRTNKHDSM